MKIPDFMHKLLLPFFTAIYCAIIGYIAAMLILKPEYISSSRCYVADKTIASESSEQQKTDANKNFLYFFDSSAYRQTLARSVDNIYTEHELEKMLSVSQLSDTGFYNIEVTAPNASDSYQLQIMIEDSLGKFVSAKSGYTMSVSFTEKAVVPESSSKLKNIIAAAAFSVIGAVCSILIRKKRSVKVKEVLTDENISEYLSYPVYGKIPVLSYSLPDKRRRKSPSGTEKRVIKINNDTPPVFRNAFSELFSSVKFGSDNPCCVISVCSAVNGEGRTNTAVNLAIAAAYEKMKVLIVDCDFHASKLNDYFGIGYEHAGISDIIFNNIRPNNAIVPTSYSSLYAMSAGTVLNDSRTAFSGPGISRIINQLKTMFDFIIIDTPPLNTFPDANTPISISDVTVLTVRSEFTTPEDIKIVSDHLRLSGNDPDGIVINMSHEESEPSFVPEKKPGIHQRKINMTV